MPANGSLNLRDRIFSVASARLSLQHGAWCIEIDAEEEDFDGELWAPTLRHQGLKLGTIDPAQLAGTTTAWRGAADSPHPEIGMMYVFGHHDVRDTAITFGAYSAGQIELTWTGTCDVFWDHEFGKDVPFACKCWCVVDVEADGDQPASR